MAIKPIMLQRQLTEVGRIRIGEVVEGTNKNGGTYTRPSKLDTFRFTSISRPLIEKIAVEYGGTVEPWTPANGGPPAWEVISETDRLPVIVTPQDVAERQYMEEWAGSRCVRRCDGETEVLTNEPCICIATDNMKCKPKTRLSVMLRDIQGLGTWRIESNGWGTAGTLPLTAQFIMRRGDYVSATLYLIPKSKVVEINGKPQTQSWMVPALEVDGVTPGELEAATGAGAVGQSGQQAVDARPAAAIEAPVQAGPDFVALIKAAPSREKVVAIWEQAKAANAPGPVVEAAARARVAELEAARPWGEADVIAAVPACETDADLTALLAKAQASGFAKDLGSQDDPVARAFVARRRMIQAQASAEVQRPPAQDGPTPQVLWSQIISAAGAAGMDRTSDVEKAFMLQSGGVHPSTASADDLQKFLADLQAGRIQTATSATSSAVEEEVPF
jgi:hypothetical protein